MSTPLLPSGLPDRLGKEALQAFHAHASLLNHFITAGYQLVNPPLMEYADATRIYGSEELLAKSFRVADPHSGNTMAVRADITPQVTRLASTTLAGAPRPLKLAYSGNVVRTEPDGLRSRRQYQQVGVEMFGAPEGSEAELLDVLVNALKVLGINNIQLDIALPGIMHHLLATLSDEKKEAASDALRLRDTKALEKLGYKGLSQLVANAGEIKNFRNALDAFVPEAQRALLKTVDRMTQHAEKMDGVKGISLDALDASYSAYFSGVAFALYAEGQHEIGRGGRYITPDGEEAIGFTFYIEDILPLVAQNQPTKD